MMFHRADSTLANDNETVAKQPGWFKRLVLSFTLATFVLQPVMVAAQDIIADPNAGAHRPIVGAAANGVAVVDIATPSAAGVSRNQYQQFNVSERGAILNNAANITATQLAGQIVANRQFAAGQAARIIVNEVTGTNASRLAGYLEVAGPRAQVVVANPNGITCSGCGFINAQRGVLTTGIPQYAADGSLDTYRVGRGQIVVEGQGLNASNVDQFDLIARSVTINAQLWANYLNVVAGNAQVKHDGLTISPLVGEGAAPAFAIDVGALGGMYANKIRLVGTEAGLGVNLAGKLAARAGDFSLKHDGKVVISGELQASEHITLSAGHLEMGGKSAAGGELVAQAKQLALSGEHQAKAVRLASEQLSTTGVLNSQSTIDLSAKQLTQQAIVRAGGAVKLAATDTLDQQGSISAAGDVALSARNLTQSGQVGAGVDEAGATTGAGALSMTATETLNATGAQLAAGQLTVAARTLSLDGKTQANQIDVNSTGALNVAGELRSIGQAKLTAVDTLTQQAKVAAGGQLTLVGQGNVSVAGSQHAGGQLYVSGRQIQLGGNSQAATVAVEASDSLKVQGALRAQQGIKLATGGALEQASQLIAGSHVDLSANAINLTGTTAAGVDAKGVANQAGDLTIQAKTTLTATGSQIAGRQLTMAGRQITLAGQTQAQSVLG
ncbi:filamentous hemagglutinin N-terminal domain-containing protein, partial [Chitinivorax tropicus]